MSTPMELIADVRQHRCVGLVDKSKSAHREPFGLMRDHMLSVGAVFMFMDKMAGAMLVGLGFSKAAGRCKEIWIARVGSSDQLNDVYQKSRRLRCSAFAIVVNLDSLGLLAKSFSSAAVISNPNAGFGQRAARFSKQIAEKNGDAALLTFDARSDVFRLYYNDCAVESVICALENLADYREGFQAER